MSSITGARVVVSEFAYRVPDYRARLDALKTFFDPGSDEQVRWQILRQYHVSKILLTPSSSRTDRQIGHEWPELASDKGFVLLDALAVSESPMPRVASR